MDYQETLCSMWLECSLVELISYKFSVSQEASCLPTDARYMAFAAAVGWLMASQNQTTYCVPLC
jgi:hypothetical protein